MEQLKNEEPVNVVFLDVDGVLNSYRNIIAHGRFPFPNEDSEVELDAIAVGMVRKLCEVTDAVIVMHSTWREHVDAVEWGKKFNLPIVGEVPHGRKSTQLPWFISDNRAKIKNMVVIDDDEMLCHNYQVWTNIDTGFMIEHYKVCLALLDGPQSALLGSLYLKDVKRVFRGEISESMGKHIRDWPEDNNDYQFMLDSQPTNLDF